MKIMYKNEPDEMQTIPGVCFINRQFGSEKGEAISQSWMLNKFLSNKVRELPLLINIQFLFFNF